MIQEEYMNCHDKLKKMKLSAMAEELRHQHEDPNIELLTFDERFTRLVKAEWQLRYDKKVARLLKQARLKFPGADFDESIYSPERKLET